MRRPRHKTSDYEKLLKDVERKGWIVTKRKAHYQALCPFECKCRVTVSATPSNQGALRSARADFNRCRSKESP